MRVVIWICFIVVEGDFVEGDFANDTDGIAAEVIFDIFLG